MSFIDARMVQDGVENVSQKLKSLDDRVKILQQEFEAAEQPTTGTWEKTQRVYNTDPMAGGYLGWVCLESGTFGTATEPVFKPFGPISE